LMKFVGFELVSRCCGCQRFGFLPSISIGLG
jgi:hypothetical protein